MESPLTDPLASALFVHHRELASPGLNERLVPVIVPGLPRWSEDRIAAIRRSNKRVALLPTGAVLNAIAPVHARSIIWIVSRFYDFGPRDILGCNRRKQVTRARHVAMYLTRHFTGHSTTKIGRAFHRDHTTILNGIQKIGRLLDRDARLRDEIDVLKLHILSGDDHSLEYRAA